ncbi:MAG: helix-turn-helix domain-containing protein [Oscillospiraceae bacterium]|nr:helix-turn-helix domain-containing protein [Oscillospiraceae bacterium]
MKDINCAAIITQKRREKGVTQEELAAYLGVTKASISKWETGVSYPDIAFLPMLASYFDISIDTLMDYTPQMTEGDISKIYQRLASDFTKKSFEEVIAESEGIIKKYYSCYILLTRMAVLYLNHAGMAGSAERTEEIIKDAIRLCERVRLNSKDHSMVVSTTNIEAMCYLTLGDGATVLELLGEALIVPTPDVTLISQAYKLLGNEEKSQEALQADLFQNLMTLFQSMMVNLQNNLSNFEKAEPIYLRAEIIADTFNMKHLNVNNVAMMYFLGAQMYQLCALPEKAIGLLSKFADVCINDFFPIALKTDSFFDKLETFLAENADLAPRNEAAVVNDMVKYFSDPMFESLSENVEFKIIVKKMSDFASHMKAIEIRG